MSVGSILANGDIGACPDIDPGFVQGNVRRDRFSQIWENGFVPHRDRTWMKVSRCASCNAFADCQGGPLHLWSASHEQLGCFYLGLTGPENA